MPRIAGTDIPEKKRLDIALTYIYGIGRTNVRGFLAKAKMDAAKRVDELTAEEIGRLQRMVDEIKVEGDLRKEIAQNITRLRETGTYRGVRHGKGLPTRGQRTRTNARTRRGKRVTIGALKKEVLAKVDASKAEKDKKQETAEVKKK